MMSLLQPQSASDPERRPRLRLLGRMLLGCLIVVAAVAAVAATIATGTLLEVKAFTDALRQNPKLDLGSELPAPTPAARRRCC